MGNSSSGVRLTGRILMGLIFLVSGFFKIMGYSQMVAFATAKGLPVASIGIACAIVVEVVGGLMLMSGFKTRIAAWILFLYLIPVTVLFHNFWALKGMEQQDNMVHFLKNLAIMGGLLLLAGTGPGAHSVDERKATAA